MAGGGTQPGGGDGRRIILRVSVELSADLHKLIIVHEGDEPRQLALEFISKHGLSETLAGPLTDHIRKNLDQALGSANRAASAGGKAPGVTSRPPRSGAGTPVRTAPSRGAGTPRGAATPRTPQREGSVGRKTERPSSARGERPALSRPTRDRPHSARAGYSRRPVEGDSPRLRDQELGRTPSASSGLHDGGSATPRSSSAGAGRGGVFEKLYQDAARKRFKMDHLRNQLDREDEDRHQTASTSHAPGSMRCAAWLRDPEDAGSHGERLYALARQKQLRQENLELQRQEQARKDEEMAATLQPDIQRSQRCVPGVSRSLVDYLGLKTKKKLENMRKLTEDRGLEECSFKPTIDARSERLMTQRISRLKITGKLHEHLYDDAQRRKERQAEYSKRPPSGATFAPDIGVDHYRPPNDDTREDFINRLVYSKSFSEKWISIQREQQERDTFSHRPQTGRSPSFDRNPEKLPIGEFLYEVGKDVQALQSQIRTAQEEKTASECGSSKLDQGSRQLFEDTKRKKYEELFKVLSSKDPEGKLRHATLCTEHLEPQMLDFLKPLMAFLEETQEHLDLERFCAALDYQREHSGRPTSHLFIERASKRTGQLLEAQRRSDETFAPRTDVKSNKIASRHRPRTSLPVHEQLLREKEVYEARREEVRLLRHEHNMEQCTFQPNTRASNNCSYTTASIGSGTHSPLLRAFHDGTSELRPSRSDPTLAGGAPRFQEVRNGKVLRQLQLSDEKSSPHVLDNGLYQGTEACAARLDAFHAQIDQAEQAVARCKTAVRRAKDTVAEVNQH